MPGYLHCTGLTSPKRGLHIGGVPLWYYLRLQPGHQAAAMTDEDDEVKPGEGDQFSCVECGWEFAYQLIDDDHVGIEVTNPESVCPENPKNLQACELRETVERLCEEQSKVQ